MTKGATQDAGGRKDTNDLTPLCPTDYSGGLNGTIVASLLWGIASDSQFESEAHSTGYCEPIQNPWLGGHRP